MKNLTKCENCGGPIKFIPGSATIECEHCNTTYRIETKKNAKILRKYEIDFIAEQDKNEQNVYYCVSCQSHHNVSSNKISKRCPSCGSVSINKVNSKMYSADGIIPFKLEKDTAQEIFTKWLHKRKLAPNDLFKLAKNGKISQVYVPVYNFNGLALCFYTGTVKMVHTDSESDTIFSTVHSLRDVSRFEISNQLYCANNTVDQDLLQKIFKINTDEIVPYSNEYLIGYYAIDTNKNVHNCYADLLKHWNTYSETLVRDKLKSKYDEIVNLKCNNKLEDITFNYTYVPVFMNHYTYKNKKYHCYINGVTGKVSGKAPKSVGKILSILGAGALVIAGIALLIMKFI